MRNVIMTGCATGLGASVKKALEARGCCVFGVGKHGPDYYADFECTRGKAIRDTALSIFKTAQEFFNGEQPDVLVNNAGIMKGTFEPDDNILLEDYEAVTRVNVQWPYALSLCMVNVLLTRERDIKPRIINTTSMCVDTAMSIYPAYCISKAALNMVTRQMAKAYADRGLVIAAVAPALVEDTTHFGVATKQKSPLGRAMTHEEVSNVFVYAALDMPEYMTGTVLRCTGGMGV
jgi:3-oxoacyl-[acyl-carrier protein] reductase